jgi:L-amino acid N-acyltransferase YncA
MPLPVRVRHATIADAASVAAIYNDGIAGHAATFETTPRSVADLERRLADVERYPVVVADAGASGVVGWAGLSEYRPRACYRGIAEFSVYVASDWHGRGVGRLLMEGLIVAATERGFWKLVSRVFTFNAASRALCRAVGFRDVGIYERHGYLDGDWRDVVVVERLIPENQPPDGPRGIG